MQPPEQILAPSSAVFTAGWHVVRAAERGDDWHPQVRHLLYYWLRRCGADSRLPARRSIEPAELSELLPCLWMLDIQRDPWRFRYRMAGSDFAASIGRPVGRDWYDELQPKAWIANRTRLITTARNGVPTWRRGAAPPETDAAAANAWSEVENLMLPLAIDGTTPDTILGITLPCRPLLLANDEASAAQ